MLRQTFRGDRIVAQYLVEVAMIKALVDVAFQRCQIVIIAHKAPSVQLCCGKPKFRLVLNEEVR